VKISIRHSSVFGSVLIIVLWVAFGLVSIALYFANSMTFELRAADNRVAALEAEQAIDGAARYALYLLQNAEEKGKLPDVLTYQRELVSLGESFFWFIGRGDEAARQGSQNEPIFSLGDEASKLNLNTITSEMLQKLPRMTPELAAAIVDWRDDDSEVTEGGAEDDTYLRLRPPYKCKNARFESIEELRMVFGIDLEVLYGEDLNQNGILDPNENDGDLLPPSDNRDGRLDPGLVEYLTVWSKESNTRSDGSARININAQQGLQDFANLLREKNFSAERILQITGAFPQGPRNIRSSLEFFIISRMTADEFAQVSKDVTASNQQMVEGLINVNTAAVAVLTCIPGIETEQANALVAYRQANPDKLTSVAWVAEVLDRTNALQAGRYLTANTYQITADIAAVGRHGRGYRRVRHVLDASGDTPGIIWRRDLSDSGWALGRNTRQRLLLAEKTR
jgi:type II secretory pathway component PulK